MRTEVDQYLSSLYPRYVEKNAQDQHYANLFKMAQNEGLNLNGLTPEQIELLSQEQLNAMNGAQVEQPVEDGQVTAIKEAQANLQLADYMGRIMAHSFHQESGFIQKEAAEQQVAGQQPQQGGNQGQAFDQLVLQYAAQIVQQQGGDLAPLEQYAQQAEAQQQMQQDPQAAQQMQAQQYQQQLAQQQQAQYQQQLQAQQAQQRQQQAQAQQQRPQGMPQQSPTAQMMGGQGQQGAQGQGQFGAQQRPGQQRQVGFQPQAQQGQGQQQMGQEQIQGQSPESVKMANDMVRAQFNEALENAAWQLLNDAGYQIDDGQADQMGQQGQPHGGQQFQQPMQ